MPIIFSEYTAPPFFGNAHVQTIFPSIFRKVKGINYLRERIATPDDDFLDIDWSRISSKTVGILCHGLEGSTDRHYMRGMARALNDSGRDALAVNFRSCSGEPNKQVRSYHSGISEDVENVVQHVIRQNKYDEIVLIGFSLGGNVILKYLGERGKQIYPIIKKAVCYSVLCDLKAGAIRMEAPDCRIYMKRFLKMLHEKIKAKMEIFPGQLDDDGFDKIKTFRQFDDRYTAPMNGFRDAEEYWAKCSCKPFIPNIAVPTLLVSAKNDPFFAPPCYPIDEAIVNPNFFLEMPKSGGHVGFISFGHNRNYWSERRMVEFLASDLK